MAYHKKFLEKSLVVCSDVDIGGLDIVFARMSNTQDIDIERECQYFCSDVLDIWYPD